MSTRMQQAIAVLFALLMVLSMVAFAAGSIFG
jgi:hypothetical protein